MVTMNDEMKFLIIYCTFLMLIKNVKCYKLVAQCSVWCTSLENNAWLKGIFSTKLSAIVYLQFKIQKWEIVVTNRKCMYMWMYDVCVCEFVCVLWVCACVCVWGEGKNSNAGYNVCFNASQAVFPQLKNKFLEML